jgi:O-antigen/teichoic acid export membrane protein
MFAPLAVWIVSTELYVDATALVPFTVISAALVSCSYFWKIQLDLVEKPHLTGVVHILSSVLLVFLCILLIHPFGLVGVGIAIVGRATSVLVLLQIAGTRHAQIEMKRSFWRGWTAATLALVTSFLILHLLVVPSYIASLCSLLVYVLVSKQTGIVDLNTLRGMVRLLTSRGPTIQAD